MKVITVHFEDEEFDRLTKIKDDTELSWREFILNLLSDREFFTKADLTIIEGDLVVTGKIKTLDSEMD